VKNAVVEIARKETKTQIWIGNCEKRKQRHNIAGFENAAQASMDIQKNTWYYFSKFQLCFCANVTK